MLGAAVVADEEALVVVRPRGLVDLRGPLDALVHRKVADVVLIDPQRPLLDGGHRVELPRGGERGVDDRLRHAVPRDVKEAHLLACASHLGRDIIQSARLATKRRADVDDGDRPRDLFEIPHRHRLEDVHALILTHVPVEERGGPDLAPHTRSPWGTDTSSAR